MVAATVRDTVTDTDRSSNVAGPPTSPVIWHRRSSGVPASPFVWHRFRRASSIGPRPQRRRSSNARYPRASPFLWHRFRLAPSVIPCPDDAARPTPATPGHRRSSGIVGWPASPTAPFVQRPGHRRSSGTVSVWRRRSFRVPTAPFVQRSLPHDVTGAGPDGHGPGIAVRLASFVWHRGSAGVSGIAGVHPPAGDGALVVRGGDGVQPVFVALLRREPQRP